MLENLSAIWRKPSLASFDITREGLMPKRDKQGNAHASL